MVCIAYYTEFNVQICNYAQKQRIYRGNRRLTKVFMVIFALAEILPTSATLTLTSPVNCLKDVTEGSCCSLKGFLGT